MAITIKRLTELIKGSLPMQQFNIRGEVRQPKISGGNMYLTMKDESSTIACIIWRTQKTDVISALKDGDMIEAIGKIDYYFPRGQVSFVIKSIIKEKTIGDLFAEFELMKFELKKNGYFDKKMQIPSIIRKIALITSMTGAAVHDFIHVLTNNKSLIDITKIDVQVQGCECPKMIIEYLNNNDMTKYDMVVITRGGGSMEDLWGFNDKKLIDTIHKRNYPVVSAIGHMVDTTLLDYVADITCATPSLAGQYIVDMNMKYINKINTIKNTLHDNLFNSININLNLLNRYENIKTEFIEQLNNKQNLYKNNIIFEIKNSILKLETMKMNGISFYNNNNKLNYEQFIETTNMKGEIIIIWNDRMIAVKDYIVL